MAVSLLLRNLGKVYPSSSDNGHFRVFEPLDLEIAKGEFLSILGPSGCGKTTLLRIIAGLVAPSEGEVYLNDTRISGINKHVGMVFQDYALFPWRTTFQNIEIGLQFQGVPRNLRHEAVSHYIDSFGLAGFENEFPCRLSGGMKQRVAIARTLITKPEVVLMDEPFGSLDSQTRNELQEFLLSVRIKQRETIVFVTHSVEEAIFLSDRIVVLSKRPSKIIEIIDIKCDRPRDKTSRISNEIRRHVLHLLSRNQRNDSHGGV